MNKIEYITPEAARELHEKAGYGKIGKFTVIDWCKKYGLGIKIGGRWKVNGRKFERFLKEGTYNDEEM